MKRLETVLEQLASVTKTQRKFLRIWLRTLMLLRGKANFRNLSRYRPYDEKTYSRGFRRAFELVEFNRLSLKPVTHRGNTLIAALDCSFIPKSGKHTYGLGKFYHRTHQKAETGLEISTLALVDVTQNTASNLSTRPTPKLEQTDETRMDWYLHHRQTDRHALPAEVRYLVTDGYYSKTKFITGVVALGLHQVGKLRHDADLRWLYQGPPNARGRPKRYDGKVNFDDRSRFKLVGQVEGVFIYTAIVNRAR